jgi:hypothetical protein
VMRQKQDDKIVKNMRAWHQLIEFLEKSLQILLGRLLCMEARFVMMRISSARDFLGDDEIRLGLSHPLRRQPFHRALFPWPLCHAGMSPLL